MGSTKAGTGGFLCREQDHRAAAAQFRLALGFAICLNHRLAQIAHASGAKRCENDSDCSVMRVTAGCGPNLSLALRALLDEEIPMIASLYAEQNCSQCADSRGFSYDLEDTPARCVEGACR